ncbi:MAG: MATE family efflux transporter [Clostridia bacterium]
MIKDKRFYKNVIAITIPIAVQNLISLATSLMDTVMLGRADNTGVFLSGSSLANQPFFILSIISFGLSGAATVLTSQYWGKRDVKSIRTIFSIVLKIAFIFSAIIAAAVLIVPETIMGLYSNNAEIIAAGTDYLRIIGWAYVLFGLSGTMICMIRSVELVKISVVVNLSSFVINVFLNWVLIFGNLGAPALGIRGAAFATLTARTLEFIITFVYIFFIDKRLCFKPKHLFLFDKIFAKDLLMHGSPVFINEFVWSLGTTLQSAILGHINYASGDPVAANSIASMTQQLSTVIIFGVANAAAVIIGKSVGEGSFKRASEEAKALKFMSYVVGAAACVSILLLKNVIVTFYTVPEETKILAGNLMTAVAFITFFVSISSITIVGILRGGGDTRFCLITEMIALWLVALPLALTGMLLKLPVVAVLLLMKIDEPLKGIICVIRINKNKWIKSLTRET